MRIIEGYGPPSPDTFGNPSYMYKDLDTGAFYRCHGNINEDRVLPYGPAHRHPGEQYVWTPVPHVSEELVDAPLTITWDGNTEGLTAVDEYNRQDVSSEISRGGWYKVSDIVLNDEEIDGVSWIPCSYNGDALEYGDVWTPADCPSPEVTEDYVIFSDILFVKSPSEKYSECGIYVKKEGVYATDGSWFSEYSVLSITIPSILAKQPTMVVHPIDPKFLPCGKTTLYVDDGHLYHDDAFTRKVSAAELDSMMDYGVMLKVNHYVYFPTMYEYDAKYGSLLSYMTEDGPAGAITKEADTPS